MRVPMLISSMNKFLAACGLAIIAGCAGSGGVDDKLRQPGDFADVAVDPTNMPAGYVRTGRTAAMEALARIKSGLTRAEVRSVLGEPDEVQSEEWWFYVINLPLADGKNHLVCQYRISFDRGGKVMANDWRRPQCRDRFNALQQTEPQAITLSSDVLFAFDSADLTAAGTSELDTVLSVISSRIELERIAIVGHTDRTGVESYNQTLSVRRAKAVQDYLVTNGVDARRISIEGRGSREPLVECEGTRVTESLKSCLQPNRRVEISIHGHR